MPHVKISVPFAVIFHTLPSQCFPSKIYIHFYFISRLFRTSMLNINKSEEWVRVSSKRFETFRAVKINFPCWAAIIYNLIGGYQLSKEISVSVFK